MANFNSGIPIPQIFNLPDLTDANQRSYSVSTKRKLDDSVSEEPIQNPPSEQTVRIWCIRTKDVGTRLASEVQRNERIVALAKLPPNNRLTARSIYWFLTKEAVEVRCTDTILFVLKHPATQIIVDNSIYYLTQIDFQKNKRGTLTFVFPDGSEDRIYCCSTSSRNNKRARLSPANNNNNVTPMQVVDDESQSAQATPISIHSSGINQFGSNFSSLNGISPSSSGEVLDYIYENPVVEQAPTSIPQPLQTDALVANYLLLVPDSGDYIHMAHSTLINCGFNLEVSSTNQQHLYSQKRMNNTIRHVLLFPYEKEERFYVLDDYLPATSEVILMLENQDHQQDLLLAVSRVNEMRAPWEFTVRGEVKTTELKFTTLSPAVKLVFSIEQLRDFTIGGACWKKSTRADQLAAPFKSYFLQWTLGRVTRQPSQIIFLCFKYEPKGVLAFTEYAATTLGVLGIEFDMGPVVVKGSVLVYLRCPAYVPWYILQRKKDILDTLRDDGLTEIYEAFISDVEASMKRAGNEEYLEELEHLREQMISDGIAEQPTPKKFRLVTLPNLKLVLQSSSHLGGLASNDAMMIDVVEYPSSVDKLPVDKAKLLTDKWVEMKKFDNKWTKTLEECYNSDKLRQQLFNFKTDKNAKIAVRVFLSSASAGLATNVAKLMRQFRGKSIVDGVHSGLQIGNTIIEWNQSGIVHIGELKYGNAVAVLFNVKDEKFMDFTEEKAQKIINFIQKWNTECQYSTKEFNSHRFVRDFLQYTMNVSLVENFKGPLGSYMEDVMRTGDVTPRLISQTLGKLVFKSHKDLEDKDRDIREKLSDDELKLLKIFHRGFQLEEAANGQDVSSCCYGLPTNGLEILNDSGKPAMNH